MTPEEWQTKIDESKAAHEAAIEARHKAHAIEDKARRAMVTTILEARKDCLAYLWSQYKPTGETVTMLDGRIAAVRWKTSRDILLVFAAPCNHSLTPMILSERDLASIYVNRRSGRMTDVNYRGIDLIEGVMPSLGDRILPPDPSVK